MRVAFICIFLAGLGLNNRPFSPNPQKKKEQNVVFSWNSTRESRCEAHGRMLLVPHVWGAWPQPPLWISHFSSSF